MIIWMKSYINVLKNIKKFISNSSEIEIFRPISRKIIIDNVVICNSYYIISNLGYVMFVNTYNNKYFYSKYQNLTI